jgi:hypothetical protein
MITIQGHTKVMVQHNLEDSLIPNLEVQVVVLSRVLDVLTIQIVLARALAMVTNVPVVILLVEVVRELT